MSDNPAVIITWFGHACFQVESEGYKVVFDPYEDGSVPGCGPVRTAAHEVFCSHGHHDHCAADLIEILPEAPSPFKVTRLDTFHDDAQGSKRGPNKITILDNGSVCVAHLGDIGCELTEEQAAALKGVDAVMIPVGGFFTIDAAQAKQIADQVEAKVVIPMHYRSDSSGYDVIGTVDAFTDQCETVVEYPDDTLEITEDTEPHTAVLTLKNLA